MQNQGFLLEREIEASFTTPPALIAEISKWPQTIGSMASIPGQVKRSRMNRELPMRIFEELGVKFSWCIHSSSLGVFIFVTIR